jgi:hypothetical protein
MHRPALSALLAVIICCPTRAAADEVVDLLATVPGLTIVGEQAAPPGFRFFVLSYEQPVNHLVPSKGEFAQRLTLLHRSLASPTIVNTDGYNISLTPSRSEPTLIVDGNELRIEHRFFMPSRPDPADWEDLTIFQAATDHHRVIQALKAVYSGRWLTTGRSKGGAAAIYHRRFYPGDVHGTVAYVAPNDVVNQHDRYAAFLDRVGTDPACRQRVKDFQREALSRRFDLVPLMQAAAAAQGFTYGILGSADRALELHVVDWAFGFWQLGGTPLCPLIPTTGAPLAVLYGALDLVFGFEFYTDQGLTPLVPATYQAATQLGYPTLPEEHLSDLLLFPGDDVPHSFLPADIPLVRFDQSAMLDIDRFVRVFGSELMFVNGENDPWSAEPFRLGPTTRDSFAYLVAGANHSARLAELPVAQRDEAIDAIRRWAGVEASTDARAARIEALDRNYEVDAARPDSRWGWPRHW